jgi:hypothetical protein
MSTEDIITMSNLITSYIINTNEGWYTLSKELNPTIRANINAEWKNLIKSYSNPIIEPNNIYILDNINTLDDYSQATIHGLLCAYKSGSGYFISCNVKPKLFTMNMNEDIFTLYLNILNITEYQKGLYYDIYGFPSNQSNLDATYKLVVNLMKKTKINYKLVYISEKSLDNTITFQRDIDGPKKYGKYYEDYCVYPVIDTFEEVILKDIKKLFIANNLTLPTTVFLHVGNQINFDNERQIESLELIFNTMDNIPINISYLEFLVKSNTSYSNFTIDETTIKCIKPINKKYIYDSWYHMVKNHYKMRYTNSCYTLLDDNINFLLIKSSDGAFVLIHTEECSWSFWIKN